MAAGRRCGVWGLGRARPGPNVNMFVCVCTHVSPELNREVARRAQRKRAYSSQPSEAQPTVIDGSISGLAPGLHGIHVHIFGDFSQGLTSAGGIFNPFARNHGGPNDEERMAGDLGNLEVAEDGSCSVHIEDRHVKLIGPHSIIGRSIVVFGGEDDFGKGGHELSLSTGNPGPRVAGGVVGIAPS